MQYLKVVFFFHSCLMVLSCSASNIRWTTLEKGDFVDVIAPGYGSQEDSIETAKNNIQKFGLSARIPEDLIEPQALGYSNTEQYRVNHLKQVLGSQEAKVIWALRGGRGTSTLLRYLKGWEPMSPPKLIVGFSDITGLHLLATQRGWPSLHAIVLGYNQDANPKVNSKASVEDVMDILMGRVQEVEYGVSPLNKQARSEDFSSIKGCVVGGNLSLIQRSIGTDTALNPSGKILFLEDVGEAPTRTYETLTHLERAGLFTGIKALLFGNFTAGLSSEDVQKYDIVKGQVGEWMEEKKIPVFYSERFGHGDYNYPLPFNTPASLRCLNADESTLKVKTNL